MTKSAIRQHPDIQSLLSRLPDDTAMSLTDKQLQDLKLVLSSGSWRKHKVDLRGTLPVPFNPSRVYFVFLMGKNLRSLSEEERNATFMATLILIGTFSLMSLALIIIILYLLKSFLGIDLFSGFSLGLWDWVKSN